jgi:starch synthase (maltosyl-transferring)
MHRHILIEAITPCVDGGRYAAKGIVGEPCVVEADVFRDGHSLVRAVVRWQKKGADRFEEAPMRLVNNDRFRGEFQLTDTGLYLFTVEAWTDQFGSWRERFEKMLKAGQGTLIDLREGVRLIEQVAPRASGPERGALDEAIAQFCSPIPPVDALEVLAREPIRDVMAALDEREDAVTIDPLLKVFACRKRARFSTWYELFPRSEGNDPKKGATLRDAERRLPKLREMGFDVIYLTPVHPIGTTNRKGKGDATIAEPGDPGSPWAIGSTEGGHTAIEPGLGTLDDFDHFVLRCGTST